MGANSKNSAKEIELTPETMGPVNQLENENTLDNLPKVEPIHMVKIQEITKKTESFKNAYFSILENEKLLARQRADVDKKYDAHLTDIENLKGEMYNTYKGEIRIVSEEGHYELVEQQQ